MNDVETGNIIVSKRYNILFFELQEQVQALDMLRQLQSLPITLEILTVGKNYNSYGCNLFFRPYNDYLKARDFL